MASPSNLYPKKVDLTNCDKEPIHILGKVQAHGVLLVCDIETENITQCSANVNKVFGKIIDDILGQKLSTLFEPAIVDLIKTESSSTTKNPNEITILKQDWILIVHQNDNHTLLEFEPAGQSVSAYEFQMQLSTIISGLTQAQSDLDMCAVTTKWIKSFFGYDRVMVYRFDEDWNGEVVAETKEEELESWLGLHYPATDIPQQARKLFLKQGVRIIGNVTSVPVPIVPELSPLNNSPIDLTQSELRAVSPIHIEYLNNMGVGATLTAAIVSEGQLWGLIACHHYSPKFINYHKRLSCKFLTQLFAAQLVLRESNQQLNRINSINHIRLKLLEQISQDWNIIDGLSTGKYNLLDLNEASGAAILMDDTLSVLGEVPEIYQIRQLINWIADLDLGDIFHTHQLSQKFDLAQTYSKVASGALCVFTSKSKKEAIIWFKKEELQTVNWAGNPHKSVSQEGMKLSPRKSFAQWSEKKQGTSRPWLDYEIASAKSLKEGLTDIILEKYAEVKALNKKLSEAYGELEAFSYSISHDLRAPLRGVDGFAQILKEDYFDQLDDFGQSAIETIISSSEKMNSLIDDILSFSFLALNPPVKTEVNLNSLLVEALELLQPKLNYPNTKIIITQDLPTVNGDRKMLLQLFSNLIGNALKYSRSSSNPQIEIGYEESGYFYVKDNGIGFEQIHEERIFEMFKRLVGEEYEGSGIGLAIAKRVVEKHNGKIGVKSALGKGSTFKFTLND